MYCIQFNWYNDKKSTRYTVPAKWTWYHQPWILTTVTEVQFQFSIHLWTLVHQGLVGHSLVKLGLASGCLVYKESGLSLWCEQRSFLLSAASMNKPWICFSFSSELTEGDKSTFPCKANSLLTVLWCSDRITCKLLTEYVDLWFSLQVNACLRKTVAAPDMLIPVETGSLQDSGDLDLYSPACKSSACGDLLLRCITDNIELACL